MEECQKPLDIEQEYKRNVNLKRDDVELLRDWARSNTKYLEISDLHLFLFLHSCYYNIENAKNTLKCYFEQRENVPEIFKNRNLPKQDLDILVTWPFKQPTKEGYRIVYGKLVDYDSGKFDLYQQAKLFFSFCDIWLKTVGDSQGFVLILDANGLNWGHLSKFGINQIRKIVAYVQEAFPIRLKGIHLININAIVEKVFILIKMFMKKELYEMTHLHSRLDTLYPYVPRSALPKDYGGDDITIEEMHKNMLEYLEKNSDSLEDEEEEVEIKKPGRFRFWSFN